MIRRCCSGVGAKLHQNRDYEATWLQKQFEVALQGADVPLTINEL
jgi:hypothetical protein